jgi:hypothetical protein
MNISNGPGLHTNVLRRFAKNCSPPSLSGRSVTPLGSTVVLLVQELVSGSSGEFKFLAKRLRELR